MAITKDNYGGPQLLSKRSNLLQVEEIIP